MWLFRCRVCVDWDLGISGSPLEGKFRFGGFKFRVCMQFRQSDICLSVVCNPNPYGSTGLPSDRCLRRKAIFTTVVVVVASRTRWETRAEC